jgi:hypothetical protein
MHEVRESQILGIDAPTGLDLSENTEYASQAALWGIEVVRMCSLINLEKREHSLNFEEPRHRISHGRIPLVHVLPFSGVLCCFLLCSIIILFSSYFYFY